MPSNWRCPRSHPDPRRTGAFAAQACLGVVQPDAKPGGAIGIAACATILNDRTNLHFTRLAENLNSSNEALNQWLAQVGNNFAALGQSGDIGVTASLRQLWLLTYREAQTQTYGDAFLMIMVGFILATAMVPLMRKVQPPAAPSADGH